MLQWQQLMQKLHRILFPVFHQSKVKANGETQQLVYYSGHYCIAQPIFLHVFYFFLPLEDVTLPCLCLT